MGNYIFAWDISESKQEHRSSCHWNRQSTDKPSKRNGIDAKRTQASSAMIRRPYRIALQKWRRNHAFILLWTQLISVPQFRNNLGKRPRVKCEVQARQFRLPGRKPSRHLRHLSRSSCHFFSVGSRWSKMSPIQCIRSHIVIFYESGIRKANPNQ